MSDSVTEQLILAVEAMGLPEAAAAVDTLTGSVDALAGSLDKADIAASGGAGKKGGLMAGLTSMKTLLAGLGIYEGVKAFSSFQSQMEKLRTQTGATQTEVSKMSKGILDMAVSVGTGPKSMAEALYHIESAGFRGQEALNALRIASQGAKIGGAELTATTTGLTAVLVAGFRGVDTLQKAMGALNATVGAGDMTFQDLNDALGTGILATFKAAGLQVNDLGASLAVLGDNNIRGAKAATQMRQAVLGMLGPSANAKKVLKEMGMGPLQMAEDLRKPNGLLVALKDLKKHLDTLSPTQRENAVVQIFGRRESGPILTLLEQLTRLESKYQAVGKGQHDFNSDWKATTKTLSFFGDQLKALGEVALIKLGTGIAWVVERVKGFISAFQHGKLWAVVLMGALSGLAVAVGVGLVGAIDLATPAVIAFTLALASNPLTWIAVAIGALTMLVIKVKPVHQAFVDTFDWIKDHWRLLAAILLGPVVLPLLFITKHFHEIVDVVRWTVGAVKTVWSAIGGILVAPFKALWSVASWVVSHVEKLLGKVLGPFKSVAHLAGGLLGGVGHIAGDVGGFLGLASGTPAVSASGAFLVGERGPEIVYLPRGSAVQPSSGGAGSVVGIAKDQLVQEINLILDRRIVARSVVKTGLEAQSTR